MQSELLDSPKNSTTDAIKTIQRKAAGELINW